MYHAVPESKLHGRPLEQILEVSDRDKGKEWIKNRRFAHPRGGKYFADSLETLAAEMRARMQHLRASDAGLADVRLIALAVFPVIFKAGPRARPARIKLYLSIRLR